uniref:Cna B domain protein n=1 Tax=Solibacter usitatus (strain Ellin6076) TaxID=234267 RepID=Q01XC9_SOLUE
MKRLSCRLPQPYTYALAMLAIHVVICSTAPYAWSQTVSGDLVGRVLDAAGSAVPNATITATNTGTNVNTKGTTNTSGEYRIGNLPPGNYDISAAANGFAKATLKNVAVQLNQIATANLTLQVGTVTTSVEVTEAPAVIDTTTAQVQNTFSSKASEDLPTTSNGFGVLNLSMLNAGVTSAGGIGVGIGTGPSVGGQRPRSNNFTVEGIDNNEKSTTGPEASIPNDAVAEFSVLQNQFTAEYGHSAGGQFNTVVKSGTNSVHGTVYEYMQNRDLNALDQHLAQQGILSNPRFDQNRLGATIGGPIIKDKWFYFGDFEYNPVGQAATAAGQLLTPTTQGYSILNGIPGLNATNLSILQKYVPASPAASSTISIGSTNVPVGVLPIAAPNFQNNYNGVASMDFNASDKDQIRGRFVFNHISFIDTTANLPVFYTTVPEKAYLATFTEYHTFSPRLTNEFRLGFNRLFQDFPSGNFSFPGLDQFPNLTFDELSLQLGPDPNAPQSQSQNTYQLTDNITWIKGNHTFKVGQDFRRYIAPQSFTQRLRGDYEYSTLELYLRDIAPDVFGERTLGQPRYYGNQTASYTYAQDTWRIRPNLSLNLGVRYEFTGEPWSASTQTLNSAASVPNVLEFNKPKTQTNAFAPRIGIAYSPGTSGNTSIRAGFGMSYDVLFDNIAILSLPPQLTTTADITNSQFSNLVGVPGFLANGGFGPNLSVSGQLTPQQARENTSGYITNQVLPYAIQWNFGIQHVFAKDYTFEARYLGTRGVHLPMQQQINRSSPVTGTNQIPTYMSAPGTAALAGLPLTVGDLRNMGNVLPQFGAAGFTSAITAYTSQGWSTYNGLALQANRRFTRGLQVQAAYTWSHLIDNSTTEFGATYLTPRRAQDFQNLTADKATSLLDRRQRFSFSAIYDAPWYRTNRSWFLKNLVGNWEIAPIYIYETPEYYTVQSGIDSNFNGDAAGDRVMVNPNGTAHTGSDIYGLDRSGNRIAVTAPAAQVNQVVAWVAVNPNARYIRAGYGTVPNAGRNTEAMQPINNIDLTLLKRFNITERLHLELSGQALNLFNHPQYIAGTPDAAQLPNNYSIYTPGVRSFVTVNSPTFNNSVATFSSNPRTMVLVGKITW